MKKQILIMLLIIVAMISCNKDNEITPSNPSKPSINTSTDLIDEWKWVATHDFYEVYYYVLTFTEDSLKEVMLNPTYGERTRKYNITEGVFYIKNDTYKYSGELEVKGDTLIWYHANQDMNNNYAWYTEYEWWDKYVRQ